MTLENKEQGCKLQKKLVMHAPLWLKPLAGDIVKDPAWDKVRSGVRSNKEKEQP